MRKIVFVFVFLFAISFRISAQWELLNSPLATPDIRNVAQHPDGYLISVSAENEIFRSDLTQNNWIKIATLDSIVYCIKINAQGIIFTGIKGGYAFSTDGGFNWEVKSLFTSRYAYISDIEFDSSEYIFMTPHSDYGAPGVWVSNNEGETWNKYTSGLPSDLAGFIGIEMDSNDKLYILSQSGGSVYSSADEGQSWQLKSVVGGNADDIEIDINDSLYVVTNGNYLYRSHDLGTSWNLILSTSISDLYIDNFNNLFGCNWYNSAHNSITYSSNAGVSWESIGHEGYSYDLIVSNNIIYSSTTSGLKKSSDNGSSWSLCLNMTTGLQIYSTY